MPEDRKHRLDRLSEAIDAYLEHRETPDASDAAFLESREELRDLLEPMVEPTGDADAGEEQRVGDFKIVREVGRGGMGVVYEAWQSSLDRKVALKVLAAHLTLSPRRVERFRREAAAAAKLHHPGIVPIYEVGESAGTYFFAMEFVEGTSLGALVEDTKTGQRVEHGTERLPGLGAIPEGSAPAEAAELAAQVAEALEHAHAEGVIHRDVKPHNILIQDGRARLVDFGLAKDIDKDSISQSGEFAGTPHYMSPEQALAKRVPLDHRTDVYSLGVVLYEMLALARPFDGDTTQEVLYQISFKEPVPVRKANPDVPRDLETICHKALEKNPERRYGSAAEMAADLRRFLRHLPIRAKPPGRITRVVKLAHRQPAATAAVVLAFLLVVVTPLAFMLYFKSAHDEIERQQAQTLAAMNKVKREQERTLEAVEGMLERAFENQLGREPTPEMRRQLEDGLVLYEQCVEAHGNKPSKLLEIGGLHRQARRVHMALGRPADAERAATRAIEMFEAAIERTPDDPAVYRQLAYAWNDLGSVLQATGNAEAAEKHVRESLRVWQRMGQEFSEEPWRSFAISGRAQAWGNLGHLQLRSNATLAQAEEHFRTSLTITGELSAEAAKSQTARFRTSKTHSSLAVALYRLNKRRDALREFLAAMKLLEALVKEGDNPDWLEQLAGVQHNLGSLFRGRISRDAERYLRSALAHREKLFARFPKRPRYGEHVLRSLNELGRFLRTQVRMDEARKSFERAVAIGAKLVDAKTGIVSFPRHHAASYVEFGLLEMTAAAWGEACKHLDRATALLTPLVAKNPKNATNRQLLHMALSNTYVARNQLGELGPAADALEADIRMLRGQKAIFLPRPAENLRQMYHDALRVRAESRAPDKAAALLQLMVEDFPRRADVLLEATRWWVRCSRLTKDVTLAEQWRSEAVASLGQAIECGFRDAAQLAADAQLAPLYEREDYKKLVARIMDR